MTSFNLPADFIEIQAEEEQTTIRETLFAVLRQHKERFQQSAYAHSLQRDPAQL